MKKNTMLKDIYIIKNNINDKVYIGQAKNSKERFWSHCKPSAATLNNELIGKAIQKYGREHFWYEILESQIENYNERELYWIKYYNSKVPNGYNLLDGGESPPIYSGASHPQSLLTDEQVEELTKDLKDSNLTMEKLSYKYGFNSITSISEFNKGKTYHRDIVYPIRKQNLNTKITNEQVDEIILLLKTTNRSYANIARDYNVDYKVISRINSGKNHYRENEKYPIRI